MGKLCIEAPDICVCKDGVRGHNIGPITWGYDKGPAVTGREGAGFIGQPKHYFAAEHLRLAGVSTSYFTMQKADEPPAEVKELFR